MGDFKLSNLNVKNPNPDNTTYQLVYPNGGYVHIDHYSLTDNTVSPAWLYAVAWYASDADNTSSLHIGEFYSDVAIKQNTFLNYGDTSGAVTIDRVNFQGFPTAGVVTLDNNTTQKTVASPNIAIFANGTDAYVQPIISVQPIDANAASLTYRVIPNTAPTTGFTIKHGSVTGTGWKVIWKLLGYTSVKYVPQ